MKKPIRKKVLGIITITILIALVLSIHAPSLYSVGNGNGYGGCTSTIGYWKTHPDAWPIDTIMIGGIEYTKAEAIEIMEEPAQGDKTYTMFEQLVAAKLNVEMGAESSCIDDSIADADQWLIDYPLGSGVKGELWEETGEPIKEMLDDYNNGDLCAPHCG